MSSSQTFWIPGNIVRLKTPYKPNYDEQIRKALASWLPTHGPDIQRSVAVAQAYLEWPGFPYGIIAHVHGSVDRGTLTHIEVFLYDPARHLIYNGGQRIPIFVRFHIDELIPFKVSRNVNYQTMDQGQGG